MDLTILVILEAPTRKPVYPYPTVESVSRCCEKSQLIGKPHSNCFAFFSNLLTYILCLTNVLRIQHKVAWD